MNHSSTVKRSLGVFSLAMITAGSVDSIRNLPATALFGSSLIFFFILGAIFFLLPSALISAELASTSKDHGGVYAWVKNAFGLQFGFLAIWFQWIENVIWYPTILSFIAGTIGYLISPTLATNKIFLITVILCAFWGATIVNLLGIKSSARFSNFCALAGLLLPMTLIIGLGTAWLFLGKPLQISFHSQALLPHITSGMWVALTGVMMSFCGMEIATVHTCDVKQPQKAYPRAMLIATLLIVFTLICGSLSIAIVLPGKKISLVAGIMQAFDAFFSAYHLHGILPAIALMLIIGGMGGINNWIIAPTRGLLYALRDGQINQHLLRENRFGAPSVLLILQSVIVSIVALIFLLLPSVNASYWLLTALASQLYMFMYILMFTAAIRLRYKRNYEKRKGFLIPGGQWGIWIVAIAGLIGSITTLIIGFIPPNNIAVGSTLHYETLLIAGLIVMSLPPFLMYFKARKQMLSPTLGKKGI
ncbi:APC family permease [Coxiella burnetii]|uniref:APC family permease n=1 Tax=Coxiella burnetii TaxID=777 RepID=UPI00217658D2|nr:APC family permease [Coxiella burnetii]